MNRFFHGGTELGLFGFTRKVDYALIALTALALEDQATGEALSACQIVQRYQLPRAMLTNVLKHLNKADLVTATRGSRGGYRLTHRPDQMHLIDILEVIEGPLRVTPCCHDIAPVAPGNKNPDSVGATTSGGHTSGDANSGGGGGGCDVVPCCPIMQPMKQLHQRLMMILADTTLADLITPSQPLTSHSPSDARLPIMAAHPRPRN